MLPNTYTLAQLNHLSAKEIDEIPIDQMQTLFDAIAARRKEIKDHDEKLTASMTRRYGDMAATARRNLGKDTGRVSLNDGDFVVRADLPKKIAWDAAILRKAVDTLLQQDEDPDEYVTIKVEVSEKKYDAWPSKIRKLFEPARTVGTGRATFEIERAKGEGE